MRAEILIAQPLSNRGEKMLRALGVGDPYSVGFRDGQAELAEEIRDFLP